MAKKSITPDFLKVDPILFEQYKIAVEKSDKISDRRGMMNNLHITLNGVIFAYIGTFKWIEWQQFLIALFGIILSILWIKQIEGYKNLNKAKFSVIHKIEEYLPVQLFKDEWDEFKKIGEWKNISNHERYIPVLFWVVYLVILILSLRTFSVNFIF